MRACSARSVCCVLGVCWLFAAGCYRSEELIEQAKQRISLDRTVEIAIGSYQVTLPHAHDGNVAQTVAIELSATVPSREQSKVQRQLAEVEPRLRDAMIVTLRNTDTRELLEPGLSSLHSRVKSTVDKFITAGDIQRLSFRDFDVYED